MEAVLEKIPGLFAVAFAAVLVALKLRKDSLGYKTYKAMLKAVQFCVARVGLAGGTSSYIAIRCQWD